MIDEPCCTTPAGKTLTYRELESQAAAMRRALEGVWSKCSKEHWPRVGEALKANAGEGILQEIEKTRYERDLLRRPVRMMVEAINSYEKRILLPDFVVGGYPSEPAEVVRTEFTIDELRETKLALQYVEATPERLAVMKDALETIAACSDFKNPAEELTDNSAEIDTLTRQIPRWAHIALNPVSLPKADYVEIDGNLQTAIRYEQALREMAAWAEEFSEDQPPHEISHALMVEMPSHAEEALDPPNPVADYEGFEKNSPPF